MPHLDLGTALLIWMLVGTLAHEYGSSFMAKLCGCKTIGFLVFPIPGVLLEAPQKQLHSILILAGGWIFIESRKKKDEKMKTDNIYEEKISAKEKDKKVDFFYLYYRFFSRAYEELAREACRDCQQFIKVNSKILDLGCGSGIITKVFQDFFQAKILGADIKDIRIRDIPFKIIDGKNLPFSNDEFDIVLIRYVLHHAENPKQLLEKAKRTSKRIIIYEDLVGEGKLDKIFCKFHLFTSNLLLPSSKNLTNHQFKTEQTWQDLFQQIGLRIIFKKRITYDIFSRLKLGKRILFVLEKN